MKTSELSTDFTSWPKERQLLSKFRALQLLGFEKQAKRKHFVVLGFILDWYHDRYGNALASVRHIGDALKARDPNGKGLFSGTIHEALNDLIAWEYLHQEKGGGRRASRYYPNWAKFSVRDSMNANSVRETPNTSVLETPNANDDSVQESPNQDPFTRPGYDPETCKKDTSSPAQGHGLAAGQRGEDGRTKSRSGSRKKKPAAGRAFTIVSVTDVDDFADTPVDLTSEQEFEILVEYDDALPDGPRRQLIDKVSLDDMATFAESMGDVEPGARGILVIGRNGAVAMEPNPDSPE